MKDCGFLWGSFKILFSFGLCLLRMCLDVPRIAIGFGHSGRMEVSGITEWCSIFVSQPMRRNSYFQHLPFV